MTQVLDIRLEALRRLPAGDAVWQLGMMWIPVWDEDEGIPPYRPRVMLCHCDVTGLVGASRMLRPGDPLDQAALDALADLGRKPEVEARPERVELDSRELHEALAPVFADLDVETALLEHLDSLDEPMGSLARQMFGPRVQIGCFTSDAVTAGRLRAYAAAAVAYHRARPWRYLTCDDLLVVESPVPAGMSSCFVVLGNARDELGLGFYEDESAFERIQRAADEGRLETRGLTWLQTFDPPHRIPIADFDLWTLHGLPVARGDAYPLMIDHGRAREIRPVAPDHLTFMEGLMRAVAASTEDDFDRGRWTRHVTTFEGEVEIALCIPALVEADAEADRSHDPSATTPAEQAQDLVAAARAAVGRQRARLARRALLVWPDCADAYVVRAEEVPAADESIALYREGVRAGQRAIGPRRFVELTGHFWEAPETQPYMWARAELALALWENDEQEEAFEHWEDMLRLDPEDYLHVHLTYIPALLELHRTDAALDWLDRFRDEPSTLLAFARALAAFQSEGDSDPSRAALLNATLRNPYVARYLIDPELIPLHVPNGSVPRGEDEAVLVADDLEAAWSKTRGAIAWLKAASCGQTRANKQAAGPRGGGRKPLRRGR